jgi:hypothetical protein
MDGLDGLMLRKARAVLQRCVAHRTSSVDRQRFESLSSSIELGGLTWSTGQAPRDKGVYCGPVKRGKPTRRWTLGHQKIRLLSREGDVQMKVSPSGCHRYLTLSA